ncbi:hypothetical protein CEXT_622281 [Caerostris extrusa]|uniref:Uncharacterized protein n=1 Tax=Caerostris extrusa TaxID=172846 RepID=A0AAV4MWA5_CAEEX|nr:hypothetical protein CEXT_622281 [Caerostris extrusa]
MTEQMILIKIAFVNMERKFDIEPTLRKENLLSQTLLSSVNAFINTTCSSRVIQYPIPGCNGNQKNNENFRTMEDIDSTK